MPSIPATYASPGLRIGLLLEDHPDADWTFTTGKASDMGVPEEWGGDHPIIVCTITRPGLPDVVGWKPVELTREVRGRTVPADLTPDWWNVQQTKALGRALKRAGYPDDMKDLKALVHWRERNAEVAAIGSGSSTLALGSGRDDAAELEVAGRADPEDVGADDAPADDDVAEAEVIDAEALDLADWKEHLLNALAEADATSRRAYREWAVSRFGDEGPTTEADYEQAVTFAESLR